MAGDLWAALGALAAVGLPMAVAWWLLGRPPRGNRPGTGARGNMPPEEDR